MPIPNPDIVRQLAPDADRDVAKRSIPGSFGYFALLMVLAVTTVYLQEHALLILSTGALLLVAGTGRFVLARSIAAHYEEHPRFYRRWFRILTYVHCLAWAAFCCATLILYTTGPIRLLVLLSTAGIATRFQTTEAEQYVPPDSQGAGEGPVAGAAVGPGKSPRHNLQIEWAGRYGPPG